MFKSLSERSFLSPVVGFTFLPVALTGVLLLFHAHIPGFMSIHKWVGLGFTIFCVFHAAVNWKIFTKYLSDKRARSAIALAVVLTVLCGAFGLGDDGRREAGRGGQGHGYAARK